MSGIAVPFYQEIEKGFPKKGEIELFGDVYAGEHKAIWVELKALDGVVVHVNIRMGANKEDITVVNSFEKGHWAREVRQPNTVHPGSRIQLKITNRSHDWEIEINGNMFRFPHRIDAKKVHRLEIRGDLTLQAVQFRHLEGHVKQQHQSPPAPSYPPNPQDSRSRRRPARSAGIAHAAPAQNDGNFGQPAPNAYYPSFGQPTSERPARHPRGTF
ncbi:Galectin [Aphelenchoides fujianensis]|nr:Galectin [Aphelenchoides fujianensis]